MPRNWSGNLGVPGHAQALPQEQSLLKQDSWQAAGRAIGVPGLCQP